MSNELTYESVLELIKESNKILTEKFQETDKKFKETDKMLSEKFKETDKKFQKTEKMIRYMGFWQEYFTPENLNQPRKFLPENQ